jgi:RimJ/RimL family protein N-acetyltransferase
MTYLESHPGYEEIDLGDIKLIEPGLEHATDSLQWVSVDNVVRHMGADFSNPSLAGERKRIQEIIESPDRYSWMINCEGKLIGNVGINDIAEETEKAGMKTGSMAILIGDPEFWKKGIATRVCTAVLEWAKTKGKFEAMAARALEENAGSRRTLEKLGFIETGTEPYDGPADGRPISVWHNFTRSL